MDYDVPNSIKKNPKCLLETNIYRWNHDNKHVNTVNNIKKFRCRYNEIEVKCIFKPKNFNSITIRMYLFQMMKILK